MAASREVPKEEDVEVAKLYHLLLQEYWGRFPGNEKDLAERQEVLDGILSDPEALRLKASCYLLYRDLREELSGLWPDEFVWINEKIRSRFGVDTRYVLGRVQS